MNLSRYLIAHPIVGRVHFKPISKLVSKPLVQSDHILGSRDIPIIANVMGPDQTIRFAVVVHLIRAHNVCDNWSITGFRISIRKRFHMDSSRYRLAHPSVGRVHM